MSPPARLATAVAAVCFSAGTSAAPMHKCTVNGTVTYQQAPCSSEPAGKRPTLQELNAAEKKRRETAAPPPPSTPERTPVGSRSAPAPAFACDGRIWCSQMTSCAEAKQFLKHCPGVKMDGNRDGIPCEQQWCR